MAKLLRDKNILIMGISNKWSIAWAIAKACYEAGAKLFLSCVDEKTKLSVEKLCEDMIGVELLICDVSEDEQIEAMFDDINKSTDKLHGVVHSLAFAKREELEGKYYDTSRDGYLLAQEISSYSLVAVSRYARPLMQRCGGSILTLTYLGGERAVPNYNVMGVSKAALESSVKYLAADLGEYGIRVNAISAPPIKTVSARGVSGFTDMLKGYDERVPLKGIIGQEEVADTAVFLISNMARGITGENIHVDGGYHILGI
ncbi:MAG: SDR family oxidoreductase [Clostridiales bacterium]|nr:SDR family oxidoreductase [Clostridiales bacterium]